MNIEIGQRYIWEEPKQVFKGVVIRFIGDYIVVSWTNKEAETLPPIQYANDLFSKLLKEDKPRLKIDKEYYRHKSLTELGL